MYCPPPEIQLYKYPMYLPISETASMKPQSNRRIIACIESGYIVCEKYFAMSVFSGRICSNSMLLICPHEKLVTVDRKQ